MAATEAAMPVEETATVEVVEEPMDETTMEPAEPMLSVSQATNCRVGPGDAYDTVAYLETDTQAKVTGWDGHGYFYVVENPDGGDDCWVWAKYATIEGDTSEVEMVETPPTPAVTISWAGTWQMKIDGKTYSVVLTQDAKVIKGQYKVGDVTYKLNGVVNADNTQVDGKWTDSNDLEGHFRFVMVGESYNQFSGEGNLSNTDGWAWCGGREGAGFPSSCELH